MSFSQEKVVTEVAVHKDSTLNDDIVPFALIERVPVHVNCEETFDNRTLKRCMETEMRKLVAKHFNTSVADHLSLSPGRKKIHVQFKIDKKGEIDDINIRAPHKVLKEEALRVISLVPIFKKPGLQRGKPVKVAFLLPIIFTVEDTPSYSKPLTKKEIRKAKKKARRKARKN